jgi:hypothetical protein
LQIEQQFKNYANQRNLFHIRCRSESMSPPTLIIPLLSTNKTPNANPHQNIKRENQSGGVRTRNAILKKKRGIPLYAKPRSPEKSN